MQKLRKQEIRQEKHWTDKEGLLSQSSQQCIKSVNTHPWTPVMLCTKNKNCQKAQGFFRNYITKPTKNKVVHSHTHTQKCKWPSVLMCRYHQCNCRLQHMQSLEGGSCLSCLSSPITYNYWKHMNRCVSQKGSISRCSSLSSISPKGSV